VGIEPLPAEVIAVAVAGALAEDRAADDATTLATVEPGLAGVARLVARVPGTLAGVNVFAATFAHLDRRTTVTTLVPDGGPFGAGALIAEVRGPVRAMLQGERVALNFIQRLSGTATLTRTFADAIAGTKAVILDTRKTTPGLRDLEKYAVRCGGGTNHRPDLAAMAMIKDNHREALARQGRTLADGAAAIRQARPGIAVEIEIDSLDDLDAALAAKPEWVLLDNMPVSEMREAVARCAGRTRLEASGGVTLESVRAVAETGVDAISVGALTHSAPALDLGLDLEF
jgi:nicotinate-nucleotide pyrophosphorylase (carboxylating)